MNAVLAQPATTASERLARSRSLLRQAMQGTPTSTDRMAPLGARGASPAWLSDLKSIPLVDVLVEAISSWWMQHPLRIAGLIAADTTRAVVRPLAQRNPVGLALGALLLGGLLAWSRPWRWILKPAMLAGLLPQLLSKSIAHLPMRSWMAALTSVALDKRPRQVERNG